MYNYFYASQPIFVELVVKVSLKTEGLILQVPMNTEFQIKVTCTLYRIDAFGACRVIFCMGSN
jgi:hypothetical protein